MHVTQKQLTVSIITMKITLQKRWYGISNVLHHLLNTYHHPRLVCRVMKEQNAVAATTITTIINT